MPNLRDHEDFIFGTPAGEAKRDPSTKAATGPSAGAPSLPDAPAAPAVEKKEEPFGEFQEGEPLQTRGAETEALDERLSEVDRSKAAIGRQYKEYQRDERFRNALVQSSSSEDFLRQRAHQISMPRLEDMESPSPEEKKKIRDEAAQQALSELVVAHAAGAWTLPTRVPIGFLSDEKMSMVQALYPQVKAELVPGGSLAAGNKGREQKIGSSGLLIKPEGKGEYGVNVAMAPEIGLVATGIPDAIAQSLSPRLGDEHKAFRLRQEAKALRDPEFLEKNPNLVDSRMMRAAELDRQADELQAKDAKRIGFTERSAVESVAERRDAFDVVMDTEFAQENPKTALTFALLTSLVIPDVGGPVRAGYKFSKGIARALKSPAKELDQTQDVYRALDIIDQHAATPAKASAEAEKISPAVAKAYREQYAIEQAAEQAAKAKNIVAGATKAADELAEAAGVGIEETAKKVARKVTLKAEGAADRARAAKALREVVEESKKLDLTPKQARALQKKADRARRAMAKAEGGQATKAELKALDAFYGELAEATHAFNDAVQLSILKTISVPRTQKQMDARVLRTEKTSAELGKKAATSIRASVEKGSKKKVSEIPESASELIAKATGSKHQDLVDQVRKGKTVTLRVEGAESEVEAAELIIDALGLGSLPRQARLTVASEMRRVLAPWVSGGSVKVNSRMLQSIDEQMRGTLDLAKAGTGRGTDEILAEVDRRNTTAGRIYASLVGLVGPAFVSDFDLRKIAPAYRVVLNEVRNLLARVDHDIRHMVRVATSGDEGSIPELMTKYLVSGESISVGGRGMVNNLEDKSAWDLFVNSTYRGISAEETYSALVRAVAARGVSGAAWTAGGLRGTRHALRGAKITDETVEQIVQHLIRNVKGLGPTGQVSPGSLMKVARELLSAKGVPLASDAEAWSAWTKIMVTDATYLSKTERLFGAGLVLDAKVADEFGNRVMGEVVDPGALSAVETRRLKSTVSGYADLAKVQQGTDPLDGILGLGDDLATRNFKGVVAAQGMNNGWLPRRVVELMRREVDNAITEVGGAGPMNVAKRGAGNAASWYSSFFTTYKRGLTSGVIYRRPRYFIQNYLGDTEQIYTVIGASAAGRQALKQAPQLGMTLLPFGIGQLFHKPLSRALDNLIRPDLTRLLDATDDVVTTAAGHSFTYAELHRIAVEKGLFETFASVDLARDVLKDAQAQGMIGKGLRAFEEVSAARLAEEFQVRQKLGVFMDLIISDGMAPKKAADKATEALFDYRNSLTPWERKWLSGFLLPWWSWEKNNHAMVYRALVNPGGAAKVNYLDAVSPFVSTAGRRVKNIERYREYGERMSLLNDPDYNRQLVSEWAGPKLALALERSVDASWERAENRHSSRIQESVILPEGPLAASAMQLLGALAVPLAFWDHALNQDIGGAAVSPTRALSEVADLGEVMPVQIIGETYTGRSLSRDRFGREIEGRPVNPIAGKAMESIGAARKEEIELEDGTFTSVYIVNDGSQALYNVLSTQLGFRDLDSRYMALFGHGSKYPASTQARLLRGLGLNVAVSAARTEAIWRKMATDKRLSELTEDAPDLGTPPRIKGE